MVLNCHRPACMEFLIRPSLICWQCMSSISWAGVPTFRKKLPVGLSFLTGSFLPAGRLLCVAVANSCQLQLSRRQHAVLIARSIFGRKQGAEGALTIVLPAVEAQGMMGERPDSGGCPPNARDSRKPGSLCLAQVNVAAPAHAQPTRSDILAISAHSVNANSGDMRLLKRCWDGSTCLRSRWAPWFRGWELRR